MQKIKGVGWCFCTTPDMSMYINHASSEAWRLSKHRCNNDRCRHCHHSKHEDIAYHPQPIWAIVLDGEVDEFPFLFHFVVPVFSYYIRTSTKLTPVCVKRFLCLNFHFYLPPIPLIKFFVERSIKDPSTVSDQQLIIILES